LICSAAVSPDQLYLGKRLSFEFERTASRLIEMQSQEYLALAHSQQ
jgi:cell division protein ZapE